MTDIIETVKISPHFTIKYKPKIFEEFHFDSSFVEVIQTFIECMSSSNSPSISPINFLFVANPGTCKTTFLQTFLRKYYNIHENAPIPENNILFINNLKEQGINYYRTEMKIFCQSHTTIFGKKKVVVIDDIDAINEQSQQVFRNCIDKYSHNIYFIATCSNIQKVIESIQSRLQIVKLPPITKEHIRTIMTRIIEKEAISIDPDAREFLLNVSNNSVRIMINYLEKLSLMTPPGEAAAISLEMCNKLCTDIPYKVFEDYTNYIKVGNLAEAICIFYQIFDYGYSVIDILYNYFLFIKITGVLDEEEKYRAIPFLCKYITAFHNIHEDSIELALFTREFSKAIVERRTNDNI